MSAAKVKAAVVGGSALAALLGLVMASKNQTAPGEPAETPEEVRDRVARARNDRSRARAAMADEMAYQAWLRGQQSTRSEP